ncbi:MAG TPA: hypothetical protein VF511_05540, partial [Chthoniobacterales bacterium]
GVRSTLRAIFEIGVLSALILATRCANHRDVFIAGEVYFTDADCYARMTRARMCFEHQGLILRHHSFENFPEGTSPHTTAPLDYLIAGLAATLRPITSKSIDLAGAIVSPLLALFTSWFLWWWSRRRGLPYRYGLLFLFAISPILVHGAELGRPDHQSLLIGLIAVALCAEWNLSSGDSEKWSLVTGGAWGLALWVSLYEPLIYLAILLVAQLVFARARFLTRHRIGGWALAAGIVLLGLLIERRLPSWPGGAGAFSNWAATIGELSHVSINDPVWLRWTGLLLIAFPALLWIALRKTKTLPPSLAVLLVACFGLTVWQARWAYFFVLLFALTLPVCLSVLRNRFAGAILILISCFPICQDWDERLWPNEFQAAVTAERRADSVNWRAVASQIEGPFLAPWWWSPAVAYWSGQPGVAGSSHEALAGIEQTARFFLAADADTAERILRKNKAAWVVAYDAERTISNSAALLGLSPPEGALGRVLDRSPSAAPAFLQLAAQNASCKLFRVHLFQEK